MSTPRSTSLRLPERKATRANLIVRSLAERRIHEVVCFSCGNAAQALRDVGLDVVEIGPGPNADLRAPRWWTPDEIARVFPNRFDATSGHLPLPMMVELGLVVLDLATVETGGLALGSVVPVLSGSGETALALYLARPDLRVLPLFDRSDAATRLDVDCPLYPWIARARSAVPAELLDDA